MKSTECIRNLLWRSAKLSINELRIIWLLAHFCQNNFVRALLIAYECFKIVDVLMFSYHTVMILPYSIELWQIFGASCSNINSIKHGPKTEFSSFFVFFVPDFVSMPLWLFIFVIDAFVCSIRLYNFTSSLNKTMMW